MTEDQYLIATKAFYEAFFITERMNPALTKRNWIQPIGGTCIFIRRDMGLKREYYELFNLNSGKVYRRVYALTDHVIPKLLAAYLEVLENITTERTKNNATF